MEARRNSLFDIRFSMCIYLYRDIPGTFSQQKRSPSEYRRDFLLEMQLFNYYIANTLVMNSLSDSTR